MKAKYKFYIMAATCPICGTLPHHKCKGLDFDQQHKHAMARLKRLTKYGPDCHCERCDPKKEAA